MKRGNKSRLKFVVREPITRLGKNSWILRDLDGVEILAYSAYCKRILNKGFATQKRYAEVVAHFIDYLIAAKVLGVPASRSHINAVLDAYPHVLSSGSVIKLEEIRDAANPEDAWLIPVLQVLDIRPLASGSFDNTLAPINEFLAMSERLAGEDFEKASFLGIVHGDDYRTLFDALDGTVLISSIEVRNMRINSVLGSVIRFRGEGLERSRRISHPGRLAEADVEHKTFPFEQVLVLAAAATSYRDRAFWLLLAASGIRTSEGKALLWTHISIETREIFIMDPRGLRVGKDISRADVIRFKGRASSFTYLIYQFKVAFFEALELYVRHEYVPPPGPGPHYVFQYVEPSRRGKPYIDATDAALVKNFKMLCRRAGIPPRMDGTEWVPHSLRHMYADYMHNDFPLANGEHGLTLPEVQLLVGHADSDATANYAKKDRNRLRSRIEASDDALVADVAGVPSLPLI